MMRNLRGDATVEVRQLASTIGKSILPDEESDPREIASGASKFPSRAKMTVTSCSRRDSRVGTSKPRSTALWEA
jgi:hypothetical protein